MARLLYAASAGDYTANTTGLLAPNTDVMIWDAYEGGNQVFDVVPGPGVTFGGGLLQSSEYGLVPFYGPDGFTGDLFLEGAPGLPRARVTPSPTAAANAAIDSRGLLTAASASATYARLGALPGVPAIGILSEAYRHWQSKVAQVRAGLGSAKLLCLGDSTTWGSLSGAPNPPVGASYPDRLSRMLGAYHVPAETTFGIPPSGFTADQDARWAPGAGWAKNFLGFGNAACYTAPAGTAAALTFTPENDADTFDVYYISVENPSFELSVDGGAVIAVDGDPAAGVAKATITTALGPGHVLSIANVTNGNCHIVGVDAYDSTTSMVHVGNGGVGASGTNTWDNGVAGYGPLECVREYAPDLTIVMLGVNDANAGLARGEFMAHLEGVVVACRESGDVLLATVVPSQGDVVAALEADYRSDLLDFAEANGIGVVDLFDRLGSWVSADSLGLMGDGFHPNGGGYADVAQAFYQAITALG